MTQNSFDILSNMGPEDDQSLGSEGRRNNDQIAESANGKQRHLNRSLIWIDLEMTGLDVSKDSILQIACIVTNGRLTETVEHEEIAIHHDDEVLAGMNAWCQEHHKKSGLVDAVRRSTVTMEEAEERVLAFVKQHAEPNSPIAGNSVHVDVQFLKKWMPQLYDYAHYRIVDVSTVGELCSRWYRKEHNKAPRKKGNHTAMSDIRESIEQLKYYKSVIFK